MDAIFILLQHLLPHHLLSRLVGMLAECKTVWLKNLLIRRFIKRYKVDMTQAQSSDINTYEHFNSFFTRALKADARSLPQARDLLISPADGAISAIGNIDNDTVFQAKGKDFSLTTLLGGDLRRAAAFRNGSFATVYLSPKDYHRVHMPFSGKLREHIYVPGKLFSVNQVTADNIDGLFARNERLVCIFDTEFGAMAVVLVGAMIVAGIETVWDGQITPTSGPVYAKSFQTHTPPIQLERGDELGRFKLGSTAIVVVPEGRCRWDLTLQSGISVRMGQAIGTLEAS